MTPLRQRMLQDMQVRNLARNTQTSYVQQVSLFARYFGKSPEALGREEIRTYQIYLTNEKKLDPGSIVIAVSALRFLYKITLRKEWDFHEIIPPPKKPQKLPVVLSPEEVLQFLGYVPGGKHRTILTTCYAAGLRISEAICLTPPLIDSKRMVLRVEQGKGQKDRYVMLSPRLLEVLRDWWRAERPQHWLFPGDIPGRHISKDAVEQACQKAHRLCHIPKPITPHTMRHCFAVHLLEQGTDVRTIQLLLGHRNLATTARYLRIATSKVCSTTSPLDLLPRPVATEPKPTPAPAFLSAGPMERPKLEVADVLHRYGDAYREQHAASLSTAQRRVMSAIELCRTAALGSHLEQCDQCPYERVCYDSCRNRHCPKCQSLARAQWIEDRQSELLDTHYFHVVFTLPEEIAAIAYQNKEVLYNILFSATSETLRTIAADPEHLGAEIGFFAVLHSWGQNLLFHPHLHCVVPGGGLSPDGDRWVSCRPRFFLPVRVLSRLFRRLFLELLEKAFDDHQLHFFSSLHQLQDPSAFSAYLAPLKKTKWVVYAKPPFAGPKQVLDYVGRYTHRVAISNNRLLDIEDGQVQFRYKDYRHDSQQKVMTLSADEFIRRFLLHVLPDGFHRIRYYGFLGNRHRQEKLQRCRQLLGMARADPNTLTTEPPKDYRDRYEELTGVSLRLCPVCRRGRMIRMEAPPTAACTSPTPRDTS